MIFFLFIVLNNYRTAAVKLLQTFSTYYKSRTFLLPHFVLIWILQYEELYQCKIYNYSSAHENWTFKVDVWCPNIVGSRDSPFCLLNMVPPKRIMAYEMVIGIIVQNGEPLNPTIFGHQPWPWTFTFREPDYNKSSPIIRLLLL